MSNSFDLALKKIYIQLLTEHRAKAREQDEEGRERVFKMLDDIEWIFPGRDFYV